MTSLYDCSLIFRSVLSLAVLFFVIITSFCLIVTFIQHRKIRFLMNVISFVDEIFLLVILNTVAENKIGNFCGDFIMNISGINGYVFVLLSAVGILLSVISLKDCRIMYPFIHGGEEKDDNDYILCRRAEQLQRDNIRLTEMNNQLKKYGEEMQEQIKQKEILQAKTQIHNGMNKLLMISSRAIETGNKKEIEKALALWHRDALLLCKEAENEENSNIMQDINSLAKLLNVKIICDKIPDFSDEKTAVLFEKSACESIINAVKHANADKFEIKITDCGFCFSNNGNLPVDKICYGGGLSEINTLAEKTGYEMIIECKEKFRLIIKRKGE